ncbi:MAG: polysaccharide biosynthesis protein [Zetaproteobacteria bacterium]|nr:MAG: polysaccharide biosynthesis protein [Zetaproteobacteria bacterium]
MAAAPFLAQALVRDPAWASEAASLFAWVFATIGWQVAASLIGGVLVGYQRLAEFRLASGCWQLIRGVGVIVFMRAHASLGWVGLWWFAGSVGLAAHALWLWRRYVPIHWRWVRPAGNAVRMLWGVALPLQINRMGGAMLGQVDKFVLAVWLGATAAGAYELAARLAGLVTLMPGLMLAAVAPAVAAMGREDRRTQRVVIVSSRYLHLAVFPLAAFLWTEAAPILHAWVGETDKAVIAAARVLVLAFALLAVQQPLANTLIGIGKERIVLRFSLLVVLLNLPMSIALVARFGLLGAAWATALVVALAAASFFAVALRSSALPWRAWAEAWWRPALALVPMIAWAQTWPEARSWADIAGAFASGVAIYLAAAWFARAITVQDWRMIRAALEKR